MLQLVGICTVTTVNLLPPTPTSLLPRLQSLSVFIALGGLLGWHTWLVVTGQGTIDAMAVQARAANGQAYRYATQYLKGAQLPGGAALQQNSGGV